TTLFRSQDYTDQVAISSKHNVLRGAEHENISPIPLDRAGKLLAFDSAGNPTIAVAAVDSATDLAHQLATNDDASKGSSLIGFKSPIAGTVGRTQDKKNSDIVSVREWTGDTVDGVISNQDAIVAAVAYCHANGNTLYLH